MSSSEKAILVGLTRREMVMLHNTLHSGPVGDMYSGAEDRMMQRIRHKIYRASLAQEAAHHLYSIHDFSDEAKAYFAAQEAGDD
jgi:hypothetical protein